LIMSAVRLGCARVGRVGIMIGTLHVTRAGVGGGARIRLFTDDLDA